MASVLDLFKDNKKDLYKGANVFIESRGTINTVRLRALALESPTPIAGVWGATIGSLIGGGNAGRPSDTIYSKYNDFAKPVSLTRPTDALLIGAVESGQDYFVKTHPSPALAGNLQNVKNIISNKGGSAVSAAINIVNKYGSKKALDNFGNRLKGKNFPGTQYGTKYSTDGLGKVKDENILFQTHYRDIYGDGTFKKRERSDYTSDSTYANSTWDRQNSELLLAYELDQESEQGEIKTVLEQDLLNIPYVLFKIYGDDTTYRSILLPATVTNLSEDFTPSISSFKHMGSPFNLYRYTGIERTLKFDLKFYYTNEDEKWAMIKKLNFLKEYTFPDRNISSINYSNNSGYSPMVFNPNILKLTINGLYKDLTCILETLAISIDDNTPWATENNVDGKVDGESLPYPIIINTSLSLKIIESPGVREIQSAGKTGKIFEYEKSDTKQYSNYFTGYNEYTKDYTK